MRIKCDVRPRFRFESEFNFLNYLILGLFERAKIGDDRWKSLLKEFVDTNQEEGFQNFFIFLVRKYCKLHNLDILILPSNEDTMFYFELPDALFTFLQIKYSDYSIRASAPAHIGLII